jgi:hypothetical protein
MCTVHVVKARKERFASFTGGFLQSYLSVTVRAQPTHSAMSHFPKKGVESQVAPTLRSCGLYVGHSAAILADTP